MLNQLPGFIGWKDKNLHYLGCNNHFAGILGLGKPKQIVGLHDQDLIDATKESLLFHHRTDQLALAGNTVNCVHIAAYPYLDKIFHVVKKPLFNSRRCIRGVIFHCQPIEIPSVFLNLVSNQSALNIPLTAKLSKREGECLFYVLQGKSARQIAELLHLSKRTVETYYQNIKNKLGCETKTELLVRAIMQRQELLPA